MEEGPDSDRTGSWETIGLLKLDSVYARPEFGFGNPDNLDEDFDLRTYVKALSVNAEPDTGPMRIDPYGPKQSEVPSDLSSSLVISSVMEPDPEWEVELLEEAPLEVYKQSDGRVMAARLAYLTGLVKSLDDFGYESPETEIHIENGTWIQVGTLLLPTGRCVGLNPRKGGSRIPFQAKPGNYIAEVFEFTDGDLGFFECDYGLRIRWSPLQP